MGETNGVDRGLRQRIIAAVDGDPHTYGFGIVIYTPDMKPVVIREPIGPRRRIALVPTTALAAQPAQQAARRSAMAEFWDRWGDSVLNCGSFAATGAVIYFSAGTMTVFAGAMAVNSGALCVSSLGQATFDDEWEAFKREGGGQYTAFLAVETAMSVVDLMNGAKGAIGAFKAWERAGKLPAIRNALKNPRLTRREIVAAIQKADPDFNPPAAGANGLKRAQLRALGGEAMGTIRKRVVLNNVSDAFTVGGAPGAGDKLHELYDLAVIE